MYLLIVLLPPVMISCSGIGPMASTRLMDDAALPAGPYTLVLYGGQYREDLETVALLDQEGDDYHIKPFGAQFLYQTEAGVQRDEAVTKADYFLRSRLNSYSKHEIRQIFSPDGSTIGYEIRPLMHPFVYGLSDLLDVSYTIGENRDVTVYVRQKDHFLLEQTGDRP
jgi:hypothetical protein